MIGALTKRKVVEEITAKKDYLGRYTASDGIMSFLSRIWPLREMPSVNDSRYSNQYDNIYQHTVSNPQDWTEIHLYDAQLNLIDGDDNYFRLFVEEIVSPGTRESKEDILLYSTLINEVLKNTDEQLIISDYFELLPVFKLKLKELFQNLPEDIIPNKIPFFTDRERIDQFPCFILTYDRWDDFGYKTQLIVTYIEHKDGDIDKMGVVKIMKRESPITWDTLRIKFTELDDDYCSLGQTSDYYSNFKIRFPQNYQSILIALRDVAIFPKINELFENNHIYKKSLTRDNDSEQLVRKIRFELGGLTEYFKFSYTYKPPYSENKTIIHLNFDDEKELPHRIIAIIGKNGVGKTGILSSLAKNLSYNSSKLITPKKPLFSKIFTVSYSFFDSFEIPAQNAEFNYVYCGLKKPDGRLTDEEERLSGFLKSMKRISEKSLTLEWHRILSIFISQQQMDSICIRNMSNGILSFDEFSFLQIRNQFSSGENIILYILTNIISEIRFDSLILYDEPETHLHPNAISNLMNTLFELTEMFKSFCILATHSPLVIQEIHTRDVIVMKRDVDLLIASKMDKDSFGENLTVITEDIFNNRDIRKHHNKLMSSLVKEGKSFEEIIQIFQYDDLPVNLNTRLYIKSLIENPDA